MTMHRVCFGIFFHTFLDGILKRKLLFELFSSAAHKHWSFLSLIYNSIVVKLREKN